MSWCRQSGETADTAFAVQEIKRKGGTVIGVGQRGRVHHRPRVDGGIYLHAGPEIAVASTKALTNMAIAFAMLALHLGRLHDLVRMPTASESSRRSSAMPEQIQRDPRRARPHIAQVATSASPRRRTRSISAASASTPSRGRERRS
jgi:glucosamine--fructose-6-phosphate aminotransferase (isomerizing)